MQNNMEVGEIINGIVCGMEAYGIFVSFDNGYHGMIHISEISDKFVKDITSVAQIGDEISCEILEIDHEAKKIKLSIKNLSKKCNGFSKLQEMMPIWIEKKLHDLNLDESTLHEKK